MTKPHIFKRFGYWYCGYALLGVGATPKTAYDAWQRTQRAFDL